MICINEILLQVIVMKVVLQENIQMKAESLEIIFINGEIKIKRIVYH